MLLVTLLVLLIALLCLGAGIPWWLVLIVAVCILLAYSGPQVRR
jgi:hypothetical protein